MTLDRTDVTASGDSERSLILTSLDIISPIRGSGDGTANEQELGQLRKQRLNLSCRLSVEGARRVGSSRRHRPLVAASTILLPPGRLRKTAKGYLQMAPNPADWFARPRQHRNESLSEPLEIHQNLGDLFTGAHGARFLSPIAGEFIGALELRPFTGYGLSASSTGESLYSIFPIRRAILTSAAQRG
jgi:hypothetical protein